MFSPIPLIEYSDCMLPNSTFDAAGRRRVVDVMESVYSADGDAAGQIRH